MRIVFMLPWLAFAGCDSNLVGEKNPLPQADHWGEVFEGEAEFYAASDVSSGTVDLTKKWYGIGAEAWGNYGPLEFWIVGESASAARDLEKTYAAVR
ncbi:MAG: hypothetical protein MK209_09865, partial [Planctomycetes bacterium]|nr:hypothetical protein [Planctomycetota bacterium]